jgi:hypothetical protein
LQFLRKTIVELGYPTFNFGDQLLSCGSLVSGAAFRELQFYQKAMEVCSSLSVPIRASFGGHWLSCSGD